MKLNPRYNWNKKWIQILESLGWYPSPWVIGLGDQVGASGEGAMSWNNNNRNFIRPLILLWFAATLMGPWMFDHLYVPAAYTCGKPFIRLAGDFCGSPMSGFQFFSLFTGGFFYMIVELFKGIFTGHAREFLSGLSVLLLMPFFTTLLLTWKKDSRRLQTINLSMWGLAFIPALMVFVIQLKENVFYLWGLWLYIVLVTCTLIVEISMRKAEG